MFFRLKREWQVLILCIFGVLASLIYIFGLLMEFWWFRSWVGGVWGLGSLGNSIFYALTTMCLIFALLLFRGTRRDMLMVLALFMILVADFFLVLHSYEVGLHFVGVTAFLAAQMLFMRRLHLNLTIKALKFDIILRVLLTVISFAITVPLLWSQYSVLYFVSAIYIAQLVANVIIACIKFKTHAIFSVALILLLLCDIFVGLQWRASAWFGFWVPFNFAWLFYAPAKVLLVVSFFQKLSTQEKISVLKESNAV